MGRALWEVRDRRAGYGNGTTVESSGNHRHRRDPGGDAPDVDPRDELWRSPVDDSFDAAAFLDDSLDDLQALGDRIISLATNIAAAEHQLLVLIAEFDARRGWAPGGYRGCAEWLMHRTGMGAGTARERVRVARALVELPETSAAMSRGELTVTRAATPENETELLELARAGSAAQVERMVRAWKKLSRADEAEVERARHLSRCFSVFPDEDGMYVVRGRLDPEVGTACSMQAVAVLMRAVEAASDALYGRTPELTPEQRRADAVGLLAERGLEVGFGEESRISGSRAERYQVMLHVEPATLSATGEPGRSDLPDGTRVPAGTSRRLSCDAGVVEVKHAPGEPTTVLDVGRRTRTIPPALRRALEVRDRGCRFPGCDRIRFTEGHHVRHWADGGETKPDNLVQDLLRGNQRRGVRPHALTGTARHRRDDDVPLPVLEGALQALEATAPPAPGSPPPR